MTRGFFKIVTAVIFVVTALGIAFLAFFPNLWNVKKSSAGQQVRLILPQNPNARTNGGFSPEQAAREESYSPRVALDEGEVIVSVLNGDFGGPMEKQFVAYRNLLELESPIYLSFIDYDESSRSYKRLWSAQTAATRPGTINLYTEDLVGDRSLCVLLSGVNSLGEHTLTVFRKNPESPGKELFQKIAELRIDGTIAVKDVERPRAYQMGIGRGPSYTISAYGRDFESANIMDQVEIVYAYNTGNGLYEQRSRIRIPGTQIEQRRVRELLGNPRAFEAFITGLWYYTSSQGTISINQYIYFDPPNREIIFYGDETQQVFTWQNSASTRYGLYIASQNISISTLRRSIDIELESLESIKVRVFEDVRLPIRAVAGVNAPWDGSYRKAGPLEHQAQKSPAAKSALIDAFIDAWYDGSIGRIHFLPNGTFEVHTEGHIRQGRYSFFAMNDMELVELRSIELRPESRPDGSGSFRETYIVEAENRKVLTLLRARIGARGVEKLNENALILTQVPERE
jgi:hypothetical protein